MTQYTLNDLVDRTLKDLNIYEAEATPSAADFDFVKQTIQSEFARMEADGIRMLGTTVDSINGAYFTLLSERMGFAIGPTFGVTSASDAFQGKLAVEAKIRELGAYTKVPEVLTIERAARGQRIRDPIISQ